ncbi:MAG: AAA family ATPase [Planctomycetaceae bacterium]|nr:AAA family ATPase [Planctomycetaceae bacterium]
MSSLQHGLDAADHFARLSTWLEMEGEAEKARLAERRRRRSASAAERTGETLLDLVVRSHTTGLGGRYLLTLAKRKSQDRLPWHRFKVGSPVILSDSSDLSGDSVNGVVSGREADSLEVAVDDWPDGDRFRIDLSPDEITRRRMNGALRTNLEATGRLAQIRDVLLGQREPRFRRAGAMGNSATVTIPAGRTPLNPPQCEAVRLALSAEDLAIIHGPPGTGKTTTVVEVICQLVERGERVLACAPSNTAVDNIMERLLAAGKQAVRLGHPARVTEALRSHSLDGLAEHHPTMDIVREIMREAEQTERQASRYTRGRPPRDYRRQLRTESRELRRQARQLESTVVRDILSDASVVCATTTFDDSVLGEEHFDVLVIDEACQSVEPGCWVPLRRADRVILAGDHLQLPPTILSAEAAKQGFAVSLMERLVNHYGDQVTRQLTVQYRMHETIMRFSSDHFYDGTLTADDQVANRSLQDFSGFEAVNIGSAPIEFIDTAGTGWLEEIEPDGESKFNPNEGHLVLHLVQQLATAGLHPADIAVIAPYAAQVRWLRQNCPLNLVEIDTVDGFQGREKEAVIISLVRSNSIGQIGFLSDRRRMNVAITRAKRKLILIGDSATLAGDDFFEQLLQWYEVNCTYRSAWEFAGQYDAFQTQS